MLSRCSQSLMSPQAPTTHSIGRGHQPSSPGMKPHRTDPPVAGSGLIGPDTLHPTPSPHARNVTSAHHFAAAHATAPVPSAQWQTPVHPHAAGSSCAPYSTPGLSSIPLHTAATPSPVRCMPVYRPTLVPLRADAGRFLAESGRCAMLVTSPRCTFCSEPTKMSSPSSAKAALMAACGVAAAKRQPPGRVDACCAVVVHCSPAPFPPRGAGMLPIRTLRHAHCKQPNNRPTDMHGDDSLGVYCDAESLIQCSPASSHQAQGTLCRACARHPASRPTDSATDHAATPVTTITNNTIRYQRLAP